jgi:hypothetical protein
MRAVRSRLLFVPGSDTMQNVPGIFVIGAWQFVLRLLPRLHGSRQRPMSNVPSIHVQGNQRLASLYAMRAR